MAVRLKQTVQTVASSAARLGTALVAGVQGGYSITHLHTPGAILIVMKLFVKWLFSAAALLLVAYAYNGVVITSVVGALLAAAVLGVLNTIVRPIFVLLTLPATVVTLGLFLFVVNALMFWAAAGLVSGVSVTGFGAALIGSLLYSALQLAIDFVLQRLLFNK